MLIGKIFKPTGFTVVEHAVGLVIKTGLAVISQEIIFLNREVEHYKNKIEHIGGQHCFYLAAAYM